MEVKLGEQLTKDLIEFEKALYQWSNGGRAKMKKAHRTIGVRWKGEAVKRAPVDEGTLRERIVTNTYESGAGILVTETGTNVPYGCVFNASTRIVTRRGPVRIADVVVADEVMTQSGDFRRVLKTWRYSVREKPNLVTITAPWRKGRAHELTLTADHKVLVYRNGRNQWIEAGRLTTDDEVYVRRKVSHTKNTGRTTICVVCMQVFADDNGHRKYCSMGCRRVAHKRANPHTGRKRSTEARARMSDAAKAKLAARPHLHPSRIVAQRGHRTQAERDLEDWLRSRLVEFESQAAVGRHVVDAVDWQRLTIYEADGAFWHQDQEKDIERDRSILALMPGFQIVHLHFFDQRFSPALIPNPLPGVHYVSCNPGPKSFTSPECFERRRILSVRAWNYVEENPHPKGNVKAKLYDLTVEGEHSFVASGIVISNSYVEFGTERIAGGAVKALGYDVGITDMQAVHDWPAKRGEALSENSLKTDSAGRKRDKGGRFVKRDAKGRIISQTSASMDKSGGAMGRLRNALGQFLKARPQEQMPFLRPSFNAIRAWAIKLLDDAYLPPRQK